jgi:hypothetical protein
MNAHLVRRQTPGGEVAAAQQPEKVRPMKSLSKRERMTVRFTSAMARDITEAARIVSRERGEIVEESALLREIGMAGVRVILARHAEKAA